MSESPKYKPSILLAILLLGAVLFLLPALNSVLGNPAGASAGTLACTELTDPANVPAPSMISFDELSNGTVIGNSYLLSFGVTFENSPTNQAVINGNEPANAHSSPNFASNDPVPPNTSNNVPMVITFDKPKTHVGMWIGKGGTQQIAALLTAYDVTGQVLCQVRKIVPEPLTQFIGVMDPAGSIVKVTLTYGNSALSEAIDDLIFAPGKNAPTRTPLPTWTPVPTAKPTAGPSPTPTAVIPMLAYKPYKNPVVVFPGILKPDLSIHGIEITQGIQCFDPSKGLAGCPDNSLPLVAQKDTTARIYLKISGPFSSLSNVPVRLYLIDVNNVTYTANVLGKATTSIDQAATDSANVYFNVNFSQQVPVKFYAVVDPNNTIAETNETNNRYPAVGYITLNFTPRAAYKAVGQRLHYHPTGYSGTQDAGGWAVNGGAADWYEQVLPVRNNAINYQVKSGYLDWTQNLSSGDAQHALIQTLNANWILENAFSFWFSGAFTGARHVYGWAPSTGYSGGHADMPVYPHAGGLGVVGIGSDAPGTNTDNPGSGALIFGHELTHDYNIYHTNTADSCGSNDPNSNFPYSSSSIQEFGFNPITGKIYNPSNTHDLMSYCPSGGSKQGWISPFIWTTMFNKLVPALLTPQKQQGPVQPLVFTQAQAVDSLVVNATIYNPDKNPAVPGKIGELYHIPGGVAYTLPQGPYAVELRNTDGQILSTQPFTITFQSEYSAHSGTTGSPTDAPPFPPDPTTEADVSFILPWMDGTTMVALTHLGQVLDQKLISANAPQVQITQPTTQQTWDNGSTHPLAWTASDADGDPLTFSIFYSNDGGANWILLQNNLSGSPFDIHADDMAGGSDVRFRVVASDGANIGFDETKEAITIPNKPPVALILNPVEKSIYPPGDLVVMEGSGTDLEDGTLPDSALVWSDDIQGGIGIGPSVALDTLTPGRHVITLTVTDSLGISSSTRVTITINYPIYLPVVARN